MNLFHASKENQYIISHHKSATMFVRSILKEIAPHIGLIDSVPSEENFISRCFKREDQFLKSYKFNQRGNLYFVYYYPTLLQNISFNKTKITGAVIIRDPRDTMVSHFFSTVYSHRKRPFESEAEYQDARHRIREEGIDVFVRNQLLFWKEKHISLIDNFRNKENILWTTYEEMVTNFDQWFDGIKKHFRWSLSPELESNLKKGLKTRLLWMRILALIKEGLLRVIG